MKHLFGTDGIRGEAGHSPLTGHDVFLIGRAAGHVLRRKFPRKKSRVVAVRDTRASGPLLLKRLSEGLRMEGVDVYDAGVLCTPSVALLVRSHKFQSGIVISASHNPPQFNGIKFFSSQARKWPDEWEREVEALYFEKREALSVRRPLSGQFIAADPLHEDYQDFVVDSLGADTDFSDLRIALDCSNGANFEMGPTVFDRLGLTVFSMSTRPNGHNINVECGSQHTEKLAKLVVAKKCHAGIAFDGDGDRVIFVDERGRDVDGDFLIALLARDMKSRKCLVNNMVVITVMANLGLKKALSNMGIRTICTPVGDRFVSQAMKTSHAALGGEQSGHIIMGQYLPTGDGLLTALHVLSAMRRAKTPLSQMTAIMQKYPQVLLNVPVKEKRPIESMNRAHDRVREIEKILGEDGRILVRYSGTEPLLRIMLEGPDKKKLETYAANVASLVKTAQ